MSHPVRWLVVACALIALPAAGYAQEAVLSGTVTDSTGAVLPGVTVVAVHATTGNQFEATTDASGVYRIPARVGVYRITADLAGFATVERTGVQLLVGQTGTVNMQMALSTVQETVTVTGEAPLIDTTTSSLGGNIDPLQMQELPIQGRDWTGLALLAPGSRMTAMGGTPVSDRGEVREFQLNMDGQQITQNMGTGSQPLYSRDSIAEFQYLSNRFDASQGRSSGVQVNAITKSGSNQLAGSFSGSFRDSDWAANDHVLGRKIPFQNQQFSGTVGGPIVLNRLHYFANYEYDRSPRTSIWNTPYPAFNVSIDGLETKKMGGVRADFQISPSTRIMGKYHQAAHYTPFQPGNTNHPAGTEWTELRSKEALGQLTQVFGNNALNEIKVGYNFASNAADLLSSWSNHWQAHNGITTGHPRVTFTGFTIAGNSNNPRIKFYDMYMIRDDFTYSYTARGRHDLKIGGEVLPYNELPNNCRICGGQLIANVGARPGTALMETIFPDVWNADTWNLNLIPGSNIRQYNIGISDDFRTPFSSPRIAAWMQDDWQITSALTLNLGLRYDLHVNAFAKDAEIQPILMAGRPDDTNNIQPRFGFAYALTDRTVIRGGAGIYFGDVLSNVNMWTYGNEVIATIVIPYDGRPDFAMNPFNGPQPSTTEAFARFCDVNGGQPGCLFRGPTEIAPPAEYANITRNLQTSIGFQRQLTDVMAFQMDFVQNNSRNEKVQAGNVNLSYNPATGVNYPSSDVSRRPFPLFGPIGMVPFTGWSDYRALQTSFTKRLSSRWQGSFTYTLAGLWDSMPLPLSGLRQVDFPVAPDLGDEYTLAVGDQRHRAVFNGIWQVGHGLQVSGLYFFTSGLRQATNYGGDLRGLGATDGASLRLRPDGTIVPRNNFVGEPIHRVDLRLQQRVPLGRVSVDGILEVFNAFNRANYASWTTQESSGSYLQPNQSTNLSFAPRTLQLGFRVTF